MADEELPREEAEVEVVPEEVQPDAPHEEPEASDEDPAVSLATELGWAPKDKWRGAEEDWSDAKTFLKNTVDINKSLRRDLKATREASERAARAASTITERAVQQERDKLLRERQQAFDNFDSDAFNRIEQELSKLPPPQGPAPETLQFQERNKSWYGIDPIASQIAFNVCDTMARRGINDPAIQLEEAEKAVRKRFPEYFEDAKPTKQPGAVEIGGSRATGPTKRGPKGFNDLPPEAKKAALDFDKRGRATKEEYAQIYWQENA